MGRRTRTDSQLNMSWTVAPAKARRNSFLLDECANETIVLVTDVPMFAPMTIGMAVFTDRTESERNCDADDVTSSERQIKSTLTIGSDHGDHYRGGRRWTLNQNRGQHSNHDANHGILEQLILLEHLAGGFSTQKSKRRCQKIEWADEQVEQQQKGTCFGDRKQHSMKLSGASKVC